jgi:hypothetical protein
LTDKDVEDVLDRVQARLDEKRQATGVALTVPREGFRRDNGWLFVTVAPADSNVRTTDYVDLLGEVEDELHTEGLNHVFLVVALAD